MLLYIITGCCIGSFFCLIAQRLPQGHSIISPRSHCVNCHHTLSWYELIPLVSICLQRFRCRYCNVSLSAIYFWAELTCGGLFVWFFYYTPDTSLMLLFWVLSAYLLSVMDCFYLMIDTKLLSFIWLTLWCHWYFMGHFHVKTVVVFSLLSWLLLFYAQDYLGTGDTFVLWCWSGQLTLSQLLSLVFIASTLGICFILCANCFFQKRITKLPFLPFLSIALLVVQQLK